MANSPQGARTPASSTIAQSPAAAVCWQLRRTRRPAKVSCFRSLLMSRTLLAFAWALILVPLALAADKPKDGFERERKEGDTTKDSLEGKSPPALKVQDWVNTGGKDLKLADLKGKVVVLD